MSPRRAAGATARAALWGVLLAAAPARADRPPARTARALRVEEPIAVDGRLAEPAWRRAPVLDGFVQKRPEFGRPPTQETRAWILHDDEAIYVGFDCRDREAGRIHAPLARRDQMPTSDRVSVSLDGLHDGRSGYAFAVTASGVLADAALLGDTERSQDWDGVWTAEVSRDPDGWTAEIRIPFRILRYREAEGHAWGLQLERVVARTREVIEWQPIPPTSGTFVSAFGELRGLEPPEAAAHLEIRPYVAARLGLGRAPGSITPRDALTGEAGADLHWLPSPDFSVDATVNPDFGQVDVDPQVVNLSPYEIFFPERRPFFLEGIEAFQTPMNLVHTRRIGAAPDVSDPSAVAEAPETTRIWGAAKGTGEVSPGTTVGALAAFSGAAYAEDEGGARLVPPLEAPALYQVARVRRQVRDQSTVGLLATGVTRGFGEGPGEQANVGAADWDLRSAGGEWAVRGQVAGSRVDRPAEAPADGWAATLFAGRVGGEPLRADASLDFLGPGFDPNDLGFARRDDLVVATAGLMAVREEPWGPTRTSWLRLQASHSRNASGDLLGRDAQLAGRVRFHNLWITRLALTLRGASVDDREARGGPDFPRPAGVEGEAFFHTDASKDVFGGSGTWVGTVVDAPGFAHRAFVTVRPVDALELGLSASLRRVYGFTRWVATETDGAGVDHFVFAALDQTEIDATFEGLLVLSRDLTFQVYVQVLRAIGDHARYRELLEDGALAVYARPDDADFDETGVSLQAVLRWEIWPGSPAFLVYRHQLRADAVPASGSLSDGRDALLAHVLDRGDDVVLAKMTVLWWP